MCYRYLVLSVCLNGAENDAWPWIGEKPAPLTRLKAGSSQGDGRNLPSLLSKEQASFSFMAAVILDV